MQNVDEHAKRILLDILSQHVGHERRIDRAALKVSLSERLRAAVSDRKMRDLINEMRRSEPLASHICGSLEGGYFTAKDDDELDAFLRPDENRAHDILARVSAQRRNAKMKNPAQMRLPVN